MKHTPGHWVVAHRKGLLAVRGATTVCVAEISSVFQTDFGPADFTEAKANARLIAAAPELYEALLNTLSWLAILPDPSAEKAINAARAALAKAGGQP